MSVSLIPYLTYPPCRMTDRHVHEKQFSAGTVGLWASTGSAALTKVVQNVAASTYTNSADWHLGVLRIVNTPAPEDWYFSGVYIESGSINTSVGSGTGGTTTPPTSTTTSTTTTTVSTTTTATGPAQTQWGQCGGKLAAQPVGE